MATNPWVTSQELEPGDVQAPPMMNPWQRVMADPRTAAAMLNAGIALMQPPSFGDTGASQIGRAIGSGAEAVGRQEEMDRKQQEVDSKSQLREASANLAGSRAAHAGTAAQVSTERLRNQQLSLEGLNERNAMSSFIMAQRTYSTDKKAHDMLQAKMQAAAGIQGQAFTPQPFPEFRNWAHGRGMGPVVDKFLGAGGGAPTAAVPTEAPSNAGGTYIHTARDPRTGKRKGSNDGVTWEDIE